jgi:outer membrane autotransporter protein
MSTYTVGSGAFLDLASFGQSVGSLGGTGSVTLGSASLSTGFDSTNTSFAGAISGSGSLNKVGGGVFTLSGFNTYTGGTTVSGGTLGVGSNTAFGIGRLAIAPGATLQAAANNLSFPNAVVLGGSGTVDTQANALTLTGSISDGTAAAAGSFTLPQFPGTVFTRLDSGAVIATTAPGFVIPTTGMVGTVSTQTVFEPPPPTPSGSIAKVGSGTLTVTGINTYTGGTTVSGGTLSLTNGSAIGTGLLTLGAGTTLDLNGSFTLGNAITISGSPNFNVGTGNSSAISGIISDATAPTPSVTSSVSCSPGAACGTIIQPAIAPGDLVKTGGGTLTLTGVNTYSGGTTVSGGTLSLTNGSAIGTGLLGLGPGTTLDLNGSFTLGNAITIAGDPTFNVGAGNSSIVSGVIADGELPGDLVKTGAGTLTLTAVNTYTGPTTIAGGTLLVDGSIANSAVTVQSGTILGGRGTVGGTINAGTIDLRRGGQVGNTLTIAGDYFGVPGSLLNLNFSTLTNSSDSLHILGNASGSTGVNLFNVTPGAPFSISPALVVVDRLVAPQSFTLASAQGFGALDGVLITEPRPAGGTEVALATVPSPLSLSGAIALSSAQSIAFESSELMRDRVTSLRDEAQNEDARRRRLPLVTSYAATQNPNDPISSVLKPGISPSEPETTVSKAVWARAFGDFENRSGNANFTFGGFSFAPNLGYSQKTGGFLGGADGVIGALTSANDGLIIGALGGFETSRVDLRNSAGNQDFSGGTVGFHATYYNGGFFTDAVVKADLLSLRISGSGVSQSTSLQSYDGFVDLGYKFDIFDNWYIEPSGGLEYVKTNFDNHFSLTTASVPLRDGDAWRGNLRVRVGTSWMSGDVRWEPSLTLGVYDVFAGSSSTVLLSGPTSISLPSNKDKVVGELQGSINFANLANGWSGFARLDARIGDHLTGGTARVGLRYQW